mmetsp:Transcript_51813/g.168409  ORF Transcript_51813/g.168409 Transcript_51813/m.168409 type:complete len:409 (+) Transcript_51813:224-1450(+)
MSTWWKILSYILVFPMFACILLVSLRWTGAPLLSLAELALPAGGALQHAAGLLEASASAKPAPVPLPTQAPRPPVLATTALSSTMLPSTSTSASEPPSTTAPTTTPTSGSRAQVAVFLLGERRTLRTKPVSTSMLRNLEPLAPYDVFVVFRLKSDQRLQDFQAKNEQKKVPIQPVVHIEALEFKGASVSCRSQEELARHALEAVKRSEERRGSRYSWIIKGRPDLLILRRLPNVAGLRALSPSPAVLVAPFAEPYFDEAPCIRYEGKDRTEFDEDWRPCAPETLKMSRHLVADQFAVVPRDLADAYFDRHTPSWTHPMPNNRPKQPPPEGEHLEFWHTCVLTEEGYRVGNNFFLGGCECGLSVYLRHIRNASVVAAPFVVGLYRGNGEIHNKGSLPRAAVQWAMAEGP